ncbi:hypothetical protein ACOMHN_010274 [Nucella lapillus]
MDVAGSDFGAADNGSSTNGSAGTAPAGLPQAALFLWTVCPPALLLLGTFGNSATILVMRCLKDDNSSQHAFLVSLAVSDLSLLYLILLPEWIDLVFHVRLVVLHPLMCKLMNCLSYVCNSMSGWLITGVTIQRTLAVTWPHRVRVVCTARRTWAVIASIALAACGLNFHFLVNMVISPSGRQCYYAGYSNYWEFYQSVWIWVDSFTYCVIPFICIVICDIILSLILFQASVSSVTGDVTSGTNAAHRDARRKTASRTTVTVLAVSSAFLVLTLPAYIFVLVDFFSPQHTHFQLTTAWAAAYNLYYANSAVNFLLYCCTGTRFRTHLLALIRCGPAHPAPGAVGKSARHGARRK